MIDLIDVQTDDRPDYAMPFDTGWRNALDIYKFRIMGWILYSATAALIVFIAGIDFNMARWMHTWSFVIWVIVEMLLVFGVAATGASLAKEYKELIPREVRLILVPYFICLFVLTVPAAVVAGLTIAHEVL
jgi:hypothetical protein